MCSSSCDQCTPRKPSSPYSVRASADLKYGYRDNERDPFPIGAIVRRARETRPMSAKIGSTAVVLGYWSMGKGGAGVEDFAPQSDRMMSILWLSSDAGSQSNGGYYVEEFDLVHATPESWRPDIKPEDRGLSPDSFGGSSALKDLEASVTRMRATGAGVECIVRTEEVVKTEKETRL